MGFLSIIMVYNSEIWWIVVLGFRVRSFMLIEENMMNGVVWCMFLCCFSYYVAYRTCKHCSNSFWVIRGSKIGFWGEKWCKNRNSLCQIVLRFCQIVLRLFTNENANFDPENRTPIFQIVLRFDSFPCFAFLRLFHPFLFWLAFGVNMKVVDNWVSFLLALEWLENYF